MNYIDRFEDIDTTTDKAADNVANEEEVVTNNWVLIVAILIFFVLWVGLGIAAFIMSLVCFGYSGSTTQHVVGVILAVLFGPFYWIYYAVSKSYCGKSLAGGRKSRR